MQLCMFFFYFSECISLLMGWILRFRNWKEGLEHISTGIEPLNNRLGIGKFTQVVSAPTNAQIWPLKVISSSVKENVLFYTILYMQSYKVATNGYGPYNQY